MKAVTVRITGKTQQTTVGPTQLPQPPLGSITIGELSSTLLILALDFAKISFFTYCHIKSLLKVSNSSWDQLVERSEVAQVNNLEDGDGWRG